MNFYTGHLRLFCLAIALVGGVAAQAQSSDYSPPNRKTEVFGGFSTVGLKPGHVDEQDYSRIRLNGWTASYTTYQFFRRWGLTAEFSGNYGTPTIDPPPAGSVPSFALRSRNHTYLFGGTYRSFERRRLALTGRILAGATHWSPAAVEVASPSPALLAATGVFEPQTAFTFGFGQSIDWKLSEAVAVRVQPDLRFVRIKDVGGDHRINLQLPFSIGLVYKFGDR